jgi:hypothetical protein
LGILLSSILSTYLRKPNYIFFPYYNKQERLHNNIETGSKTFEKVENFKFWGMVINSKNNMTETIQDRIQAGNKAYSANQMDNHG